MNIVYVDKERESIGLNVLIIFWFNLWKFKSKKLYLNIVFLFFKCGY